MRKLNAADFANDREYREAKRQMRKADQTKRQSETGRRQYQGE